MRVRVAEDAAQDCVYCTWNLELRCFSLSAKWLCKFATKISISFLSQALWWGVVSMAHQVRGSSWAADSLICILTLTNNFKCRLNQTVARKLKSLDVCVNFRVFCFTLYLLFIAHLNSSYPVGHWTWQQNNQKKKRCHSPAACLVAMEKDAAFAHRLSHVYEVFTLLVNDNPIALQLPHHREMPPCLICA